MLFLFMLRQQAKPSPAPEPPQRQQRKAGHPSKWRGGQGQRDRRDFQSLKGWFQRSGSNENQHDPALLSSFEEQQFVMERSLPAHSKLQQSLQQLPNPVGSFRILLLAKFTTIWDFFQSWKEGLSFLCRNFLQRKERASSCTEGG